MTADVFLDGPPILVPEPGELDPLPADADPAGGNDR